MASVNDAEESLNRQSHDPAAPNNLESLLYQLHGDNNENEPLPSYAGSSSHIHLPVASPDIAFAPEYIERPDPVLALGNALARNTEHIQELDLLAWLTYISSPYREDVQKAADGSALVNNLLIKCFFVSIYNGHTDIIKLVISEGILTANTILRAGMWNAHFDKNPELIGETPLIRAVKSRDVGSVNLLLELGADVDAFSSTEDHYSAEERVIRTPLQLAASMGHLIMVKLLMEKYHANDSLIAPDGQIALRLAADSGHAEIVSYLPSRRAGGYRRWKFKNRKSIARAKRAGSNVVGFTKFFVWDIEKFFLWTCPKHMIAKPLHKACKWCWENKGRLSPWIRKQLALMPGRLRAFGSGLMKIPKAIWSVLVKIPVAVWKGLVKMFVSIWKFVVLGSKTTWTFATKTLPKFIKDFSIWLWKFLTVRVPKAVVLIVKWLWNSIISFAKATWHIILKFVSFLSTIFEAVISFFQRLTLADIWNGFVDMLHAIFVSFPKTIWSWIENLGEVSYKVMKALFGLVGQIFWYIGLGCLWVVTYIPRQIGRIVRSIGESFWRAGHEIRVFFDPKAR